jgi:hypothetical protein
MASREKYSINFTCPDCGKKGVAEVAEDSNSMYEMGKPNRVLESVSNGFQITNNADCTIFCVKCQKEFPLQ